MCLCWPAGYFFNCSVLADHQQFSSLCLVSQISHILKWEEHLFYCIYNKKKGTTSRSIYCFAKQWILRCSSHCSHQVEQMYKYHTLFLYTILGWQSFYFGGSTDCLCLLSFHTELKEGVCVWVRVCQANMAGSPGYNAGLALSSSPH